jgi:FkbM family methyltransferase
MSRAWRGQIKGLPVVGPILYHVYLKAFKGEGERLRIGSGPLAGKTWIRFARTFVNEYLDGSHEQLVQQALIAHLKPGMVFYDVGAHGGFFTLLGAELVGPSGKVVSFEPHPKTSTCCQGQIEANNFRNVTVVTAAVADRIGEARFADNDWSDMSSLKNISASAKTITVQTTTLDHEITRHPSPDVMKIDIEGAEIEALSGASNLISKKRPVLLVELHSQELAEQYDQMMHDFGYETFSSTGERISAAESGRRFVISKSAALSSKPIQLL